MMISGNTPDEMMKNGMQHMHKAHPEMAKEIEAMPKADGEKWMEGFKKKWNETPES